MTALLTPTAYTIDPWDPSYGVAVGDDVDRESSAVRDLDIELPISRWQPLSPPDDVQRPSTLLFLDGVQRIDARLWVHSADPQPVQGLVASLAAGLVCCDGQAHLVDGVRVDRSLYSSVESATDLQTSHATYAARHTAPGQRGLQAGVAQRLAELEAEVATSWRENGSEDDLLVLDGPLRRSHQLPRTVGYVKTHHTSYLPQDLVPIVAALEPGQRTPVFRMGSKWVRHSWYLRLPGMAAMPWSAVVRLECPSDLDIKEVIELADLTATLLPPLSSTPHKDSRAPQNLVPIGGLERQLRHRLGDAALLYRSLRASLLRNE